MWAFNSGGCWFFSFFGRLWHMFLQCFVSVGCIRIGGFLLKGSLCMCCMLLSAVGCNPYHFLPTELLFLCWKILWCCIFWMSIFRSILAWSFDTFLENLLIWHSPFHFLLISQWSILVCWDSTKSFVFLKKLLWDCQNTYCSLLGLLQEHIHLLGRRLSQLWEWWFCVIYCAFLDESDIMFI